MSGTSLALHIETDTPHLSLDIVAPAGEELVSGRIYPPDESDEFGTPATVHLDVGQPACAAAQVDLKVYEISTDPQTQAVLHFSAMVYEVCPSTGQTTRNIIRVSESNPDAVRAGLHVAVSPDHPKPMTNVTIAPKVFEEGVDSSTRIPPNEGLVEVTRSSGGSSSSFVFDLADLSFTDQVGGDPVRYTFHMPATPLRTAVDARITVRPRKVAATLGTEFVNDSRGVHLWVGLRDADGPVPGAQVRIDARSGLGIHRLRTLVTNAQGAAEISLYPRSQPWTYTVTFAGDVAHMSASEVSVKVAAKPRSIRRR